jgi:hypothetical protein
VRQVDERSPYRLPRWRASVPFPCLVPATKEESRTFLPFPSPPIYSLIKKGAEIQTSHRSFPRPPVFIRRNLRSPGDNRGFRVRNPPEQSSLDREEGQGCRAPSTGPPGPVSAACCFLELLSAFLQCCGKLRVPCPDVSAHRFGTVTCRCSHGRLWPQ